VRDRVVTIRPIAGTRPRGATPEEDAALAKELLADAKERAHWDAYMQAYEDMVRHTASEEAPWFVVPADNKWFTRLVVAEAVVAALQGLSLRFPELDAAKRRELEQVRALLEQEDGGKAGA